MLLPGCLHGFWDFKPSKIHLLWVVSVSARIDRSEFLMPFLFSGRGCESKASTGLPHGSGSSIHRRNLVRLFTCVQYVCLQEFRDVTHTGLSEHGEMVSGN